VPDRDYVAELGYLTDQGDWLQLIRSLHVRVPAA
jgi:phosphate transport system substrate-binding protein